MLTCLDDAYLSAGARRMPYAPHHPPPYPSLAVVHLRRRRRLRRRRCCCPEGTAAGTYTALNAVYIDHVYPLPESMSAGVFMQVYLLTCIYATVLNLSPQSTLTVSNGVESSAE